jgi:hypothetical protein
MHDYRVLGTTQFDGLQSQPDFPEASTAKQSLCCLLLKKLLSPK